MPRLIRYRATVYRKNRATKQWAPLHYDLECDRQRSTGGAGTIAEREYGRVATDAADGFFDTGLDIRQGDGVSFTHRSNDNGTTWDRLQVAENYEVNGAEDFGDPGDLELELSKTGESFS